MTDERLQNLYRRLTAADPVRPEATAALAAWAESTATPEQYRELAGQLAASSRLARVAQLLKASRPIVADLVAAASRERTTHRHPRRARAAHRHVSTLRRAAAWLAGSATAVAAMLAIALGLQHGHQTAPASALAHVSASTHAAAPVGDRIFTTRDTIFAASGDGSVPATKPAARSDELFHGSFQG